MARMSGRITGLAAGASSGNILSGLSNAVLNRRSLVKFYAVASATGIVGAAKIGNQNVLEDNGSNNISIAARFPIDPDDKASEDVGLAMDVLSLSFRNISGGALDVHWAVDVFPI